MIEQPSDHHLRSRFLHLQFFNSIFDVTLRKSHLNTLHNDWIGNIGTRLLLFQWGLSTPRTFVISTSCRTSSSIYVTWYWTVRFCCKILTSWEGSRLKDQYDEVRKFTSMIASTRTSSNGIFWIMDFYADINTKVGGTGGLYTDV